MNEAENATLESIWSGRRDAVVTIINSSLSSMNSTANIKGMDILDQQLSLTVKALPNPSQNDFQIYITSNHKGAIHLRSTDISGRVVEERKIGGMNQQIKIGEKWLNGTYILEVSQGEERKTLKLVKYK